MIKNIYALFDKQTSTYQNPLHFLNHGDAIRWLTTITNPNPNQEQSVVSRYPEQFILFHTASYDDATGQFENVGKEVIHASEVKEHVQEYTLKQIYEKFIEFKNQEEN